MNENFKPGDIVQLKSGGLPMTVVGHERHGVSCQWQDAEGRPQSAIWNAVALKISETSPRFDAKVA